MYEKQREREEERGVDRPYGLEEMEQQWASTATA
jgi:hypothetical protein